MSSINLLLQGIPDNSKILDLTKTNTSVAETLRYFSFRAKWLQEQTEPATNDLSLFDQCVSQIVKEYRNIWEYECEIHYSSWDILAYLLSPS